jgi:4a-hydroxytetrahydrobiopterin dehydratase
MLEKLNKEQIDSLLKNLRGWEYKEGSIRKTYFTMNYPATMGFVTAIGGFCQRHNHHPEYVLMKYKSVEVSFSTHSVGGVTQKDIDIAVDIEKYHFK